VTSRRTLILLAPVLAAAALAAGPTSPASAFQGNPGNGADAAGDPGATRCAPITDRVFTGTIRGADGLGVNTTIGFDMQDDQAHTKDLATGCAANGYSTIVQLNHDVSGEGAPIGSEVHSRDGKVSIVGDRFTVSHLPANVTNVWVETYTRHTDGSPCGLSCAGPLDVHKYGMINRRAYPLDGREIAIALPLTPAFGGRTGSLAVHVVDGHGHPYAVQKEYAWSMAPEGEHADQGWGIGVPGGTGNLTVPSLGSNQDYVTWVYTDRGIYVVKHLPVRPLQATAYTLNVDGPLTVDLTTVPARSAAVSRVGREKAPCQIVTAGSQVTFHCKATTVAKNTVATLSGFKYGRWIPLHRAQVQGDHSVLLTSKMRYVGTQAWRIDVGSVRDGYSITGRA